jgi:hypothetical protein
MIKILAGYKGLCGSYSANWTRAIGPEVRFEDMTGDVLEPLFLASNWHLYE